MGDKKNINHKLAEIFQSDLFNQLEAAPAKKTSGEISPLQDSFEQINKFYETHQREPLKTGNRSEKSLANKLEAIRKNHEHKKILLKLDKYHLLESDVPSAIIIENIEDVFDNDTFGLLDIQTKSNILNVREGLKSKRTTMPSYVAKRTQCEDFHVYEPLFKICNQEIQNGERKVAPFANEQEIEQGLFFVLKGVLLYVAHKGELVNVKGKKNARLRCIFENGTESDMLLRSLSGELYKNGRRVTEKTNDTFDHLRKPNEEDIATGHIYVVKSLSQKQEIQSIENLYKIGFSSTDVPERIKRAKDEPAYLMDDVQIVKSYRVYNMSAFKFEQLMQRFFAKACVELSIADKKGMVHKPREWFSIPLEVIEQAIPMICSGDIVNYQYNNYDEVIEPKD